MASRRTQDRSRAKRAHASRVGVATSEVRPWLFGPAADLLLGFGLGYAVLVGVLASLPTHPQELQRWETLATLVTGMPHYGATLLRVYERRGDRRRYALFAIWASLSRSGSRSP